MIERIGDRSGFIFGMLNIFGNKLLSSSWFVIISVLAPLAITSCKLLIDFSTNLLSVIIPITVTSFSIKAIGPCFNSPD